MSDTLLIEFQAAQKGWIRWHTKSPSSEAQRNYGRRWRWTALWERIWRQWITENQVLGTLDQFVEKTIVFWQPLYPLLDADVLYDSTIEIEWERWLLENSALKGWPQFVQETWDQMLVTSQEVLDQNPPEAVFEPSRTISEGNTSLVISVDQHAPVIPMADQPVAVTNQCAQRHVAASDPQDDALLFEWQQAMQQAGVSKSYSRQRRREVASAMIAAGCTLQELNADDLRWQTSIRHAIGQFQQWLQSRSS